MWKPIETYPIPDKELDYDSPKALFYSPKTGIVIGYCILWYKDDQEYSFYYGDWTLEPTHWMPLPERPRAEG